MISAQYQPPIAPEVAPEPTIPSEPGYPESPADPTMPEPNPDQGALVAAR